MTLISADSHICEPTDTWISRMPSSMKDRAPYYRMEDDNIVGYIDGQMRQVIPGVAFAADTFALDLDIKTRLEILEADGIWGEGLLGNLAGVVLMSEEDPELSVACARAYNDWLAEVKEESGGRVVGHAYLPMVAGTDAVLAEIDRVSTLGLRSLIMPLWPVEPYYLRHYDPIWEAAADRKMPICMHAHTGRWFRKLMWGDVEEPSIDGASMLEDQRDREAVITAGGGFSLPQQGMQCIKVAGWFIGSGTFERVPDLKLVFLECGAAWMLSGALWLDEVWYRLPGADRVEGTPQGLLSAGEWKLPRQPSEYLREHCLTTFQFEKFAVDLRHTLGLNTLMWGADTPHTEGTWPHTRKITSDLFGGIPENEARAIKGGTAAELFGVALPTAV